MKVIKVFLVGADGQMGKEIEHLLHSDGRFQLVARITRGGFKKVEVNKELLGGAGVIIDFSTPDGFLDAVQFASKNKISLVSGTTGLGKTHFDKLKRAANTTPALWAANMSRGVNLFLQIIESCGSMFQAMDLRIDEAHHKRKKDKPSGTALQIKRVTEKSAKQIVPEINVIRAGGIVGEHKLHIIGDHEKLTIEHVAWSRRVFAQGALDVAAWLVNQKPGLYTMKEFIGDVAKS